MPVTIAVLYLLNILLTGNENIHGSAASDWKSIFNGHDLMGWTPKFSGFPAGENYKQTFLAEDSMLRVSYAHYDSFRNEFGHIFYKRPYRYFKLRLEYRFTGGPLPGTPSWAIRNNGVMFYSQSAQSMLRDQDFPVSIELQLLGGDGSSARPTGNVCTPGTHVYINGVLETTHCISSSSKTFDGDQWVKLELDVLPDGNIYHIVEGDTVMKYRNPVIGGGFLPDGFPLAEGTPLTEGYIALQAESAPTDFRKIMIQEIH